MSPSKKRRSTCPIAIGLDIFGDAWSLLIIRDLMFYGKTTYQDFLESDEQIASNILSDRLARLEREGLISKANDPADKRRRIYTLTAKGIDLAPVLVAMTLWSARHEKTAAPPNIVREMRRDPQGYAENVAASLRKKR